MELRLEVYSNNEAAMRSYEKAGFSKYVTKMRIGLAES
jgi:ribosomal protein S18 acetylase RimI-like enzyme